MTAFEILEAMLRRTGADYEVRQVFGAPGRVPDGDGWAVSPGAQVGRALVVIGERAEARFEFDLAGAASKVEVES